MDFLKEFGNIDNVKINTRTRGGDIVGIKSSSDIFFILSVTFVMLATIGWAAADIWLAPTQWLLVAITMGIWGIYLRMRDVHEKNGKKK